MTDELSAYPRTAAVLRYVARAKERAGFPPTIREICDAFGWSSTNAAAVHLDRLKDFGLVETFRGVRTLSITPEGWRYLEGR